MQMGSWAGFAEKLAETTAAVRDMDAAIMGAGADAEKLCEIYLQVVQAAKTLDAQRKLIEQRICEKHQPTIGEIHETVGAYDITIAWPERYDWDEEKLAETFASAPNLPAFVDQTFKINKRAFDRADQAEQDLVRPALTRKPGTRSIDIVKAR
ncbi:hypothetical protein UFOVP706_62 [uncultured Caudovirales phage]|uniref:Uncharacterized protein n=1 Tax=uncultured Caudovirales phage TaxID=2100421 RepID=A0A6J5NIM1_9CAUD|nr:hypothetical protein UFOVP706_62 [uncultured Caudovirales phage]